MSDELHPVASSPLERSREARKPFITPALLTLGLEHLDEEGRDRAPPPDVGAALQDQIAIARQRGLDPRVVVIDSLIDGYRIGSSTPREDADALCKVLVGEGLVGVLVEEAQGDAPSPWPFVADTVLELRKGPSATGTWEHTVLVRKHRFAASHPGPHELEITHEAVHVAPAIEAYTSSLRIPSRRESPTETRHWISGPRPKNLTEADYKRLPDANGRVALLYGPESWRVAAIALELGRPLMDRNAALSNDALIAVDARTRSAMSGSAARSLLLPPKLGESPARWLSRAERWLAERLKRGAHRIVVGDLAGFSAHINVTGYRYALRVIVELARAYNLPIVLFETRSATTSGQVEPSNFATSADLLVEVQKNRVSTAPINTHSLNLQWTDVHSAQSIAFEYP